MDSSYIRNNTKRIKTPKNLLRPNSLSKSGLTNIKCEDHITEGRGIVDENFLDKTSKKRTS